MTRKRYLTLKNKIIDVEITINEVEIAAFEHQFTKIFSEKSKFKNTSVYPSSNDVD